ncbi:MAG: beta-ketoacyl synthase N-terminal-like domain-containing protein, partial [bacterium]
MSQVDKKSIAVIGVGARMPGAANASEFFSNICQKVSSITDVPTHRWDARLFHDPDPEAPDRTYSRIGGFLDEFKPQLRQWRIPPTVAKALDPTQILALDVTDAALRDAGLTPEDLRQVRCAVILGNSMGGDHRDATTMRLGYTLFERDLRQTHGFRQLSADAQAGVLEELRQRLDDTQPPITEDTMAGELSNVIAGRVAAAFRLNGPNYSVDAACAASLAAVSAAVRSLLAGECDVAITGGVDRNMGVAGYVKFCKTHALSARGSSPFDADADGFVMGEGAGILILRRLTDAVAHGDRIRAVIRGVGASSDAGAKGITAPSSDGQLLAMQRAYAEADVDPATVGLIEAHGTSTRVGDAAEVQTLCRLFGDLELPGGPVAVGSVKSNIGHLKSAAGAAALIKAVLALDNKVLPPSANYRSPNEALQRPNLPIRVQTTLEPWEPPAGLPRRAGVSAFGFGGTNFHVVLEEYLGAAALNLGDDERRAPAATPASTASTASATSTSSVGLPDVGLFRLGAATREELDLGLTTLSSRLAEPFETLAEQYGRPVHESPVRAAITAADAAELADRVQGLQTLLREGKGGLKLAGAGTHLGEGPAPKLAALFPGQGSQYVGMLADLKDSLPTVSSTLAEADRVMADLLDQPLSHHMLGLATADSDYESSGDAAALALQQTTITQPAMLAADVALLRTLAALGVWPDMVAGHSLGEYAACVAAGVLELGPAMELVAARGREMAAAVPEGADPGQMAFVAAPADRVEALLEGVDGYVVAANKNSSSQTVIAGASGAVQAAIALFEQEGVMASRIPVSHAFHSQVVSAASAPLRKVLQRSGVRTARLPIFSNVTAELYPDAPEDVMELLARQVASPVEFIAIVEQMYRSGARTFVEIGPKKALASFVRDILAGKPHRVTHTNHPKKGGPRSLVEALALLSADGQPVGATHLFDRDAVAAPADAGAAETAAVEGQAQRRPAAAATSADVWITGVALGLPGRATVFADDNLETILAGTSLIDRLAATDQQPIVNQRIERLVKAADGTGTLVPVSSPDEVMGWAGRKGTLDLVKDYCLASNWDQDRDATTRLGVAAAFEALRDAWLPLVEERKEVSGGRTLGQGFRLPPGLGRETGVIFASAFAGYSRLVDLMAHSGNGTPFPRSTLLQILGLGHAHIAEVLGAMGPNILINTACASTTSGVAVAEDWIRAGRCQRVLVVGADDVTSPELLPWIGGGFLALGAATTERDLSLAAVPFGPGRNGLILGMGAASLLVESAEAARARGVRPQAEVIATRLANSAAHPLRLRPDHIAEEVERIVEHATTRLGIDRSTLARDLVFMSHETYTPARGGSAQAEVDALRKAFGADIGQVLVVNTKGFTGHPMAAGIEDATAVAGLWSQTFPPVANLAEPDPEFADLSFHRGGAVRRRYALRLAAGFGSQIALTLYRRSDGDGVRVDEPVFRDFLTQQCGIPDGGVVRDERVLRARSLHRSRDAERPDELTNQQRALTHENDKAVEIVAMPRTQDLPTLTTPTDAHAPQLTEAAVLARLQAVVAQRTGYDLEELEPDLELEADLGIDTVKQAEIVGELRTAYSLERDDSFRLTDYPTLEALAAYILSRLGPERATTQNVDAPAQAEPAVLDTPAAATATAVMDVPAAAPAAATAVVDAPAPAVAAPTSAPVATAVNEAAVLARLQAVVAQ